jgi:hypothetical protein
MEDHVSKVCDVYNLALEKSHCNLAVNNFIS